MSGTYVEKKPNEKEQRRSVSFTNYYECTMSQKYGRQAGHCIRVLASRVETWVLTQIETALRHLILKADIYAALEAQINQMVEPIRVEISLVKSRLNDADKRVEGLTRVLGNSLNEDEGLREPIQREIISLGKSQKILRNELAALQQKLTIASNTFVLADVEHLLDDWQMFQKFATPQEIHEILKHLIRCISCDSSRVFSIEWNRILTPEEASPELVERLADGTLRWKSDAER